MWANIYLHPELFFPRSLAHHQNQLITACLGEITLTRSRFNNFKMAINLHQRTQAYTCRLLIHEQEIKTYEKWVEDAGLSEKQFLTYNPRVNDNPWPHFHQSKEKTSNATSSIVISWERLHFLWDCIPVTFWCKVTHAFFWKKVMVDNRFCLFGDFFFIYILCSKIKTWQLYAGSPIFNFIGQ